jgi:uncharacterized membrane protein
MRKISGMVFIILLMLCIAHAAYYYPLLPDKVASHFGASGRPDAWASKEFFLKIYLIAVAFVAVLFPATGFLVSKIPNNFINLPNKDYWLSPERRQVTVDFLLRQFLWFGSATLMLLLDIMHQSFRVHLGQAGALEHPVASLVTYVAFSTLWSIGLVVKFMRKP